MEVKNELQNGSGTEIWFWKNDFVVPPRQGWLALKQAWFEAHFQCSQLLPIWKKISNKTWSGTEIWFWKNDFVVPPRQGWLALKKARFEAYFQCSQLLPILKEVGTNQWYAPFKVDIKKMKTLKGVFLCLEN